MLSSSGWRPAVQAAGANCGGRSDKVSLSRFRAGGNFLCHINMDQPGEKSGTSGCVFSACRADNGPTGDSPEGIFDSNQQRKN
jgi:hypothetical protein